MGAVYKESQLFLHLEHCPYIILNDGVYQFRPPAQLFNINFAFGKAKLGTLFIIYDSD
jgi:hypothetical protein